ncbi:bacillithiol biosynthesis BshC [Bacillus carboniphilus]|uniref:Bacillithiol biosynthesis BshC n=1 Tax=Bacillus carboniphilus TaxID=86663 RepID=A0ABY9JXX2_9BACI|nr:bacillithiol biosynthesis BshC [Bacillus carboniphilus]WLR43634.1 bacillithiol biosynthesis BshC [Bacillus carboniphilus]
MIYSNMVLYIFIKEGKVHKWRLNVSPAIIHQIPFVNDYLQNRLDYQKYFNYHFHDQSEFEKRYTDVMNYGYPREQLVRYLLNHNRKYGASSKTINNIEMLLDKESVAVIGGQQAGLLTGPLYTIHKIISIITLARQQQELLGKPVIPIFWVAGEDHDFDEINHLHVHQQKIKKNGSFSSQSIKANDF